MNPEVDTAWWSERTLEEGEGLSLGLGPIDLTTLRSPGEWRIATSARGDMVDQDRVEIQTIFSLPEDAETIERYAGAGNRDTVRIEPRTADRGVVVSPRIPLFVPAGEEIRIFVSAPIWLAVTVGPPDRELCEKPVKRLTDTWFGSSTRDGELAYAARTQARLDVAEMPPHHHRATTPVMIRNRGDDTLAIDRINLPVPYLSLYAAGDHLLWTQEVTMIRTGEHHMAEFSLGSGAPRDRPSARRIAGPRLSDGDNLLVRAFATLARGFGREGNE